MRAGRVRSKHDPRLIHLSHVTQLPTPPPEYFAVKVQEWPVLGNDKVPCCTCAAVAHMIHHWSAAHETPILLDERTVLGTFLVVSGGTEEPVEMLDVLKFWRKEGIAQRKSHSYVGVDPDNVDLLKSSIYLLGAAYIGLNFPDFVLQNHASIDIEWRLPAGGAVGVNAPNPANGHCVAAIGYTPERLYVVSCGQLRWMTWDFYLAYNEEAYGVLSHEWYGDERISPNGFNLEELQREIMILREARRAEAEVLALAAAAAEKIEAPAQQVAGPVDVVGTPVDLLAAPVAIAAPVVMAAPVAAAAPAMDVVAGAPVAVAPPADVVETAGIAAGPAGQTV